ncbi:hypothetical protein NC653_027192 [Populus alba x Populus x berolinensis]|uniref:Transmembrane protein n=1 Tax=Populus alba x Populus x berolinensis TaxID=444605 RepID=A0AAD6Q5T2_9ROSI|nr:hypothetical protein NC653_027192 [Populus alba x Populus x berolinensis]
MQIMNIVEEPKKGRRLPGVRERGGWADGGSWWPFLVWRQAMILLRLFFFSWCRDTVVVLEEQTMASLMKTVVSLPLRFLSSLLLPPLLLLFLFLQFRSSPSLFFFVVFSFRFCFSPLLSGRKENIRKKGKKSCEGYN